MIAMAPIATSLTVTPASSAADDAEPVERLAEIVNAPPKDAATADREEAALQLVARDTPASRDDVLSALKNTANSAAQAAITKALADVPNPDPALIPVLAGLLPNATLTDAAATALAN